MWQLSSTELDSKVSIEFLLFCLWLRRLWPSETSLLESQTEAEEQSNYNASFQALQVLPSCLRLEQSGFHWIISDQVISRILMAWQEFNLPLRFAGLACACVDLQWLAFTLLEMKFALKSTHVFQCLAHQRKWTQVLLFTGKTESQCAKKD